MNQKPVIPFGCVEGWKIVRPDLTTRDGYRWPWPGNWATADNIDPTNTDPCPTRTGDGLCIAKTWKGAASGGYTAVAALHLAYRPEDVLGEDPDKLRVSAAFVVDVFDPQSLIRAGFLAGADLAGAYLTGADLTRANLTGANLTGAYLTRANLARADLTRADLAGANLAGAYLAGADLAGAYLARADLTRANLTGANLTGADLTRANLTGANLTGAYLTGADLTGADLTGAYLAGAYLARADLTRANLTGAFGDSYTRLPDGWNVLADGTISEQQP